VRKCYRIVDQWLFKLLLGWFTQGRKVACSTDAPAGNETVLLFKPDGIGDFILWTEVFKEFAARYRKARITMFCCAPVGELVRAMFPDWQTIEIPKRTASSFEFLCMSLREKIFSQAKEYDLLVDLRVHRGDWELLSLAMFKAGCKIGFASSCPRLQKYDHLIFNRLLNADLLLSSDLYFPRCHELKLVESFFLQYWAMHREMPLPDLYSYFSASRKESPTACAPQNSKPLIVLHPGSGNTSKNWPPVNWLNLTQHLLKHDSGCRVAVVAGKRDVHSVEFLRILNHQQQMQWWYNLPLPELASRLVEATLFVGHDTGISHLAAAVGVSSLVLFGPTEPAVWAPPHAKVRVLRAPQGKLNKLSVGEVLAAIYAFPDLRVS
jgi:ADP-heptose:LPS heptosyltransferase